MKRREYVGWTAALAAPLTFLFGEEVDENISEIQTASSTPLGQALEHVENELNREYFSIAVMPGEETGYYTLEEEADNSYSIDLSEDGIVDIRVDTSGTDWDKVVEETVRQAHLEGASWEVTDENSFTEDEFYRKMLQEHTEAAILQSTDLLAAYAEATVSSRTRYYENSERAEPGMIEETLEGKPRVDTEIEGYILTMENIELRGEKYEIRHQLPLKTLEEASRKPSIQGSWKTHMDHYRQNAEINQV